MEPTEEQAKILDAKGRVVGIDARAGTGKTTTLLLLAQKYAGLRVLYLVFNASQRYAAKKKFPKNTVVHTTHSLAYGREGYLWKDNIAQNFTPHPFMTAFEGSDQQHLFAQLSYSFITYYLNSPYQEMDEAVEPFLPYLAEPLRKTFTKVKYPILKACREMMIKWHNKKEECPHDFYLKLVHLDGRYQDIVNSYDVVLFDEKQDSSPIIVDVAKNCTAKVYMVGDEHQQIYSWRYAQNAMNLVPCDEEFQLTQSFRFGPAIADIVQTFVRETLDDEFVIKGTPGISSQVFQYSHYRDIRDMSAVLSRANTSVFKMIADMRNDGIPYRFERDLTSVVFRILDVYRIRMSQHDQVKDPFLRTFESFLQLEEYAEEMNDLNLRSMITVVKTYQYEMPGLLFDVLREAKKKKYGDEITIATAHSSKGCEYEHTVLDMDLAKILNKKNEVDDEEYRLAYVAMTRAMRTLYLHQDMDEVAGPEFEAAVHALPRV